MKLERSRDNLIGRHSKAVHSEVEPLKPVLDTNLTLMHQHQLSIIEGSTGRNPHRLSLDTATVSKSVSALATHSTAERKDLR